MTKLEYKLISEAIEKCRQDIINTFDRFNASLTAVKMKMDIRDLELSDEANSMCVHND